MQDFNAFSAPNNSASNNQNTRQNNDLLNATPSAKPRPSQIRRWGETVKPPEVEWLVDQLILKGALNTIAGEPGVGKTRMAIHIAGNVVTGSSFAGHATAKGPVVYLDFDDNETLPRTWMERVANGLGVNFSDLPIYYWSLPSKADSSKGLLNEATFDSVVQYLKGIEEGNGEPVSLIVVDTFESAFPSIDSNNKAVLECYARLQDLRNVAPGATVLVIDHTPKPGPNDVGNRGVSGNQQKKAKVRTQHLIYAEPAVPGATFDVVRWVVDKNNAAAKLAPFAIRREYDRVRNADYISADVLPRSTPSHRADEAFNFALNVVRSKAGDPIARKELRTLTLENTSVGERTIDDALGLLQKDERVEVEAQPTKGAPLTFRWKVEPRVVYPEVKRLPFDLD
jgi:hypothetical protein